MITWKGFAVLGLSFCRKYKRMDVHCIEGKGFDSNVYLVIGKETTIIDTGTGLHHEYVLKEIKRCVDPADIKRIILTHEHADHCGGVHKILKEIDRDIEVGAHPIASKKLERGIDALFFGFSLSPIQVDLELNDNDRILIGDEDFIVFHTPGHTPGSICLYSKKSKALFSGDTIFQYGSFGRFDLPGGDARALLKSIERLLSIDVDIIYPGHGEVVTEDGKDHIMLAYTNLEAMVE